jgi:hypothetical protein
MLSNPLAELIPSTEDNQQSYRYYEEPSFYELSTEVQGSTVMSHRLYFIFLLINLGVCFAIFAQSDSGSIPFWV